MIVVSTASHDDGVRMWAVCQKKKQVHKKRPVNVNFLFANTTEYVHVNEPLQHEPMVFRLV